MIICGFAGIGKSTVAKSYAKWIDLESTPFEKDWGRYTKVADHMSKQGYNVMVSCHEGLRETLHDKNIDYILVLPDTSLKDEYVKRYTERGNTKEFITSLATNWESYTATLPWETDNIILLSNKDEYMDDVIRILANTNKLLGE